MGWASAGPIFDRVAQGLIDAKAAPEIAQPVLLDLIEALTDQDWDTVGESRDEFTNVPMVEDVFFRWYSDRYDARYDEPLVCASFRESTWRRGCSECGWSQRIHDLEPRATGSAGGE